VIVGGDVVPFQPIRGIFTALEQLRASPNEAVMIGDNENDHAAARAALWSFSALWLSARASGNARAGCVNRSVADTRQLTGSIEKVTRITSRAALKIRHPRSSE
jgi:phosphoglycolate phosphatase-like HAD superfamily hydrolase